MNKSRCQHTVLTCLCVNNILLTVTVCTRELHHVTFDCDHLVLVGTNRKRKLATNNWRNFVLYSFITFLRHTNFSGNYTSKWWLDYLFIRGLNHLIFIRTLILNHLSKLLQKWQSVSVQYHGTSVGPLLQTNISYLFISSVYILSFRLLVVRLLHLAPIVLPTVHSYQTSPDQCKTKSKEILAVVSDTLVLLSIVTLKV